MPTNLRELGVNATEEDLVLMAHKCAVGVNGGMGSAKFLREEDMLAIYRASMWVFRETSKLFDKSDQVCYDKYVPIMGLRNLD